MSFSVVQSNAGTSSALASVSTSFVSGVTIGNSVLVHVSYQTATGQIQNVADNQGNLYFQQGVQEQANGITTALYLAVNVAASGTFTVTATLSGGQTNTFVSIFEVTGLAGYPSNDGVSQGTGASGTALSLGSVTTQNANDVIICAARALSGTISAGSGFTLVAGTLLEYQVVSSTGTYSGAMTNSVSTSYAGTMVALKLGTQTGFNPWTSGVNAASGSALEFTDTWGLNPGNILQYERTQAWTVLAAVKLTSASTNTGSLIFSNVPFSGPAFPGYELWVDTSGFLRVRIISNIAGPNYIGVIGATNIIDSTWHYLAATYDGSSTVAGVNVYLDGTLQTMTTESNTLTTSIVAAGQSFIIGNQQGRLDLFGLHGYLDNFSIHNTVRNSTYISTAAGNKNAISVDSNVQLYYTFDDGVGNVVRDLSSNGFNSTIPDAPAAALAKYKFPLGPYAYV